MVTTIACTTTTGDAVRRGAARSAESPHVGRNGAPLGVAMTVVVKQDPTPLALGRYAV